ncbi:unnamed protein product [Amoebophrya sp. A25]|nr:unnamed protein product [Amoebophrya sp. A25]|eukprot:GSA25T00021150001.1
MVLSDSSQGLSQVETCSLTKPASATTALGRAILTLFAAVVLDRLYLLQRAFAARLRTSSLFGHDFHSRTVGSFHSRPSRGPGGGRLSRVSAARLQGRESTDLALLQHDKEDLRGTLRGTLGGTLCASLPSEVAEIAQQEQRKLRGSMAMGEEDTDSLNQHVDEKIKRTIRDSSPAEGGPLVVDEGPLQDFLDPQVETQSDDQSGVVQRVMSGTRWNNIHHLFLGDEEGDEGAVLSELFRALEVGGGGGLIQLQSHQSSAKKEQHNKIPELLQYALEAQHQFSHEHGQQASIWESSDVNSDLRLLLHDSILSLASKATSVGGNDEAAVDNLLKIVNNRRRATTEERRSAQRRELASVAADLETVLLRPLQTQATQRAGKFFARLALARQRQRLEEGKALRIQSAFRRLQQQREFKCKRRFCLALRVEALRRLLQPRNSIVLNVFARIELFGEQSQRPALVRTTKLLPGVVDSVRVEEDFLLDVYEIRYLHLAVWSLGQVRGDEVASSSPAGFHTTTDECAEDVDLVGRCVVDLQAELREGMRSSSVESKWFSLSEKPGADRDINTKGEVSLRLEFLDAWRDARATRNVKEWLLPENRARYYLQNSFWGVKL